MNGNNSLFNLIFPQMNPAAAVSTGVAHDEIDKLIEKPKQYKKGEFRPSSALPDAQEEQYVVPINMDDFAELFKLGFSKDALREMMADKRWSDEAYRSSSDRSYWTPMDVESDPKAMQEIYEQAKKEIKESPSMQKMYGEEKIDKIYNTILSRVEKGDAPGGLVGYVFPKWGPGDEPGWRGAQAEYVDAFSGRSDKFPFNLMKQSVPDTMLFYREALQQFLNQGNLNLGTAYHEPLHSAMLHGPGYNPFWVDPTSPEKEYKESDWMDELGRESGYSSKSFQIATDKMQEDALQKVGADSLLKLVEKTLNTKMITEKRTSEENKLEQLMSKMDNKEDMINIIQEVIYGKKPKKDIIDSLQQIYNQ